ncbi:MAG: tetratricopeptide repeat protein [Syntrophobacteraceae bacterium]|nr:tetratricopeptide repeat protein [Syntrophobacteraceae bacterium]
MKITGSTPFFVLWLLAGAVWMACEPFSQQALACGPFFEEAHFTGAANPDAPLEDYLQGRLGIPQPTYARSYLFVACRYLAGKPLGQEERKGVLKLMNRRISAYYREPDMLPSPAEVPAVKEWFEVRSKVAAKQKPPDVMTNGGQGWEFRNCLDDAFKTAARTLRARMERFGAHSPVVTEWVKAQDQVFADCSDGKQIPGPVPPGSDPLASADRAYQVASALFYSGRYDEAAQSFRAVAEDPRSPWRLLAPYLEGRALLRKAFLGAEQEEPRDKSQKEKAWTVFRERLTAAERRFQEVLDRSDMAGLHASAREMINLIHFRLAPDARRSELGVSLLAPDNSAQRIQQDLNDYIWLLDMFRRKFLGDDDDPGKKARGEAKLIASLDGVDELTDWIFTFQISSGAALDHALKRYDAGQSIPWLVAVLSKITPQDPHFPKILEHARTIGKDSPAYPWVGFHLARCLMSAGKPDEARAVVDQILSLPPRALPRSSSNLLLATRMKLARNLDEFLRYAPRVPARITVDPDNPYEVREQLGNSFPRRRARLRELKGGKVLFDADAAIVFNEMLPLRLWIKAIENPILPERLRLTAARAAWVRGVLLDKKAAAAAAASFLKKRDTALSPFLSAYNDRHHQAAGKATAIFAILKNPGLTPYVTSHLGRLTPPGYIDTYHDNWWCALRCSRLTGTGCENPYDPVSNFHIQTTTMETPMLALYPDNKMAPPGFLSASDREAARSESTALASLGPAPNYLSEFIIACAKGKSADIDLPEALHLCVRATRYGCTDEETTKYSKAAFELLHKKYPRSSWTKKTPLWF